MKKSKRIKLLSKSLFISQQRINQLVAWKEEVIRYTPDLQAIGQKLGLRHGDSIGGALKRLDRIEFTSSGKKYTVIGWIESVEKEVEPKMFEVRYREAYGCNESTCYVKAKDRADAERFVANKLEARNFRIDAAPPTLNPEFLIHDAL